MQNRSVEKKPQRILARLTAQELTIEDLGRVRGATDNQDPGSGGGGGGASCALVTQPCFCEDN
jgi:hypothetical protein